MQHGTGGAASCWRYQEALPGPDSGSCPVVHKDYSLLRFQDAVAYQISRDHTQTLNTDRACDSARARQAAPRKLPAAEPAPCYTHATAFRNFGTMLPRPQTAAARRRLAGRLSWQLPGSWTGSCQQLKRARATRRAAVIRDFRTPSDTLISPDHIQALNDDKAADRGRPAVISAYEIRHNINTEPHTSYVKSL